MKAKERIFRKNTAFIVDLTTFEKLSNLSHGLRFDNFWKVVKS